MAVRIFEITDRIAAVKHNYTAKVPIVFEPLTFNKIASVKLNFSTNTVFDELSIKFSGLAPFLHLIDSFLIVVCGRKLITFPELNFIHGLLRDAAASERAKLDPCLSSSIRALKRWLSQFLI